ncbi:hypothetical protein GCM10009557_29760 [Virgisporangium ochraceum]|uniref:Uncharacterized protein n=1 Tax=Virgisporangium ochraceum TaxID=65505 RepID=A0A8J4EFJ5_9ACTN|nr:hypothetical protein [Virgisporangium ochraceum]GIJ72894.1 hypothetical protein Voc01_078110 [Virgisporangium ochraceum]
MSVGLEIENPLNGTGQPVADQNGTVSPLVLGTDSVGVRGGGTAAPVEIARDVTLEYNGSPRLVLHSRGNGTQRFSIRATNDRDDSGGRRLVVRNESQGVDILVFDLEGIFTDKDIKIERSGSPRITLYSRGDGTQRYSMRATNDADPAGGRRFVVRNESAGEDDLILDSAGRLRVRGDIILTGADCAEVFPIDDAEDPEPGTVMVLGDDGRLRGSDRAYDQRVAGVISGAGDYRPGLVLGGGSAADTRLPLALNGRVFCKVDAVVAPVGVGDLLTTSTVAGHAMRATDRDRAFGAVIGKALRPLASGRGLVPILVALQ